MYLHQDSTLTSIIHRTLSINMEIMCTRKRQNWTITLLSMVLVLATAEFAIGGKSSPSLDIQVKWASDEANHVDIIICVVLPEEQEVNTADTYLMTLSDYTGTTIRADKSNSPIGKVECFEYLVDNTKFDMEEYVDVFLYRVKSNGNKAHRRYMVLSENINIIVPKVNAVDRNLVLVEWNNPDGQLFTLSYDADGSSPMLCNSQICQFILNNSKRQKYMNFVIKSENKAHLQQKTEIGVNMDIKSYLHKGLSRINYIRQSINKTDGDPYLTIAIEAPDLPTTECFWISIEIPGHQQADTLCNGWNGDEVVTKISHAVLPAELENITIRVIALDNANTPVDVTEIDFGTYAFDTAIAIVGSDSDDTNVFLRVQVGSNEADQLVGDKTCLAGSTCYYPYTEQTTEERYKDIKVGGNENVIIKQYDDSVMPIINFDDLSEVTLVNEKILDIAADYNASANSIEAIIIDPNNINNNTGGIECSIDVEKDSIISCNLDINIDMTDLEQLNIVVMMLDPNGKVLESSLVVLKDLKMKVEMFTSSSLKVTWNRNFEDQYILDIDPVPSSYKSINTMCKSALENCLAFFTDVDAIHENYTLSVKEIGSKTKFVQTIAIMDIPDHPAEVNITKVIESNDGTKLELDLSQFTKVSHIEVAVTRLDDTDMAKQTLINAQKIKDGNIYTSSFPTNPDDEDAFDNETELIILGYDEQDEVLVTSYLKYQYADIQVDFTSVGNSVGSEGSSLRVASITENQNLYVGDSICPFDEACYIIEPKTQTLAICTDGVNDKETPFKLCDETQEPLEFQGINEISNLILTDTNHLEVSGNFNSSKESVEILLYDPTDGSILDGAQLCIATGINSTCTLALKYPVPDDLILFNLLIVVIDSNQKVMESLLQPFEDLKIKVEIFPPSLLQVTWNGNSEEENYLLDRDPVSDMYKSLSSTCKADLENCLAFFSNAKAEIDTYTISVKKKGSKTSVAQTIKTIIPDQPLSVNISKVIESKDGTKLEVDLSQVKEVMQVELAVTRLSDTDMAIQSLMDPQKVGGGNIYPFMFPTNPAEENAFNNVTELIILGYNAENEVIVTSYLSYKYTDILVGFTSVGNSAGSEGSSFRVAALREDQDLYVGDSECPYGEACYIIEPKSKALEICVDGVNDIETQFKQCDDTREPIEYQGINEITNLILTNENSLEVSADFNSSKDTVEILLYDPINKNIINDAGECMDTKDDSTCLLEFESILPDELYLFNVLIIVLDNHQKVMESFLQPFQDLKLHSCLLTDNSFEVFWNQKDPKDEYTVSVSPKLIYSSFPGICPENDTCKAFFIDSDDHTEYTLMLQQKDDIRMFAATLNVPENIDDIPPPITIHKLIKSVISTKISVAKEGISGLDTLDVSITTDVDVLPVQTYYTAEKITEDENNILFSVPFVITPEERSSGGFGLILIGKDKNDDTVGSASMSYHYKEISVDITSVGNDTTSDGWSVRVAGLNQNQNLLIGNKTCSFENQPCYIIEPQEDMQEVCEEVHYNDNMVFYQCDETLNPVDFKENENISQVILRDDAEIVIISSKDPEVQSSEIYIYYADDVNSEMNVSKCENPTSCSIPMDILETENILKILVVSLNEENNVLKSSLILFEDLKLNITNLTPDILAVNWHHGVMTDNYRVYLESENLYFMSNLESSCDNDATCTALFSNIDPEHQYKVTVQKESDDLTKMSKSYTTSDDIDSPIEIGISNIIESEGFTKITLNKTNLPSSLKELGVSITSKGAQTFVPATMISDNDDSVVYSIQFVFASSKKKQNTDETEMVLVGLDESKNVIASAEINFQYQEISTKISPVGAALDNDSHSLRVVLRDGEALQNSDNDCAIGSPCYLIEPNSTISACGGKIDGNEFVLCNEASSDFKEISDDVTVKFSTEGVVDVSTTLTESDLTLEVVVYNEKYPYKILSNDDKYKCAVTKIRGQAYSCSQNIRVTKDLEKAYVLVVAIDSDNSVVQSTRKIITINTSTDVETWVIVVSSIGGLFGLIFIIFAVVVTWKKITTKKQEKEVISQNHDTRSENNSNLQNEHEDPYGEDLHMSHLRPQENGHENPSFDDSRTNINNIAQNTGNYSPQNNTQIVNNRRQNPYAEPYTPGNVAKRISRPYEDPRPYVDHRPYEEPRPYEDRRPYAVPRPKHPYPNARQRSPPHQHANSRHSNVYDSPLESDYYLPNKQPAKPKEPIYARLVNDGATRNATEPIALAPIPRISMHPSRAKQYKAITETTAIPPQGRWDVDV